MHARAGSRATTNVNQLSFPTGQLSTGAQAVDASPSGPSPTRCREVRVELT